MAGDERKLDKIGAALSQMDNLGEKLPRVCLEWSMHGIDLAVAFPDVADMFALRFPAVRQFSANFEAFVAV